MKSHLMPSAKPYKVLKALLGDLADTSYPDILPAHCLRIIRVMVTPNRIKMLPPEVETGNR